MQFNENDLIVFRGYDGYKFNVMQLTKAFHAEEATPRTKIKGNILTMIEGTENFVTFQRDDTWGKGSMNFVHVLRTPDEEIVQLPEAKVVTEEVVFFSVTRKPHDEICSIAVTFENSVSEEHRLSMKLIAFMISMMDPVMIPNVKAKVNCKNIQILTLYMLYM